MISFFIPIRKGSKRVINKNTRPILHFKKGLTEIKVRQLLKLKHLLKKENTKSLKEFEFVISTNCEKVKQFVKKFKWIKVHNRSKNLSMDDSLDKLCLEVPKICNGDYILWTHVTSPNFTHIDYIDFLKKFFKKKKVDSKIKSSFSADLLQKFLFSKKKKWLSHNAKKKKWPRTQDLLELYTANSAVFFASRNVYSKYKDRLCNNPLPIISKNNSGYDIDDLNDFKNFKKIIKNEN